MNDLKIEENEMAPENVLVSSEPCHSTTSQDETATHFVRSAFELAEERRDNRTAVVPIRFTISEREHLRANANEARLSLSEWVRRAALQRRMPPTTVPAVNLDTYQELCRVGNNLNQLMRAIHSEGRAIPEVITLLESLSLLVKTVGFQTIGATAK